MMQTETNHIITLAQKVDRHLLLVLKEQQKQVLMMRIDHFGFIEDQTKQLNPNDEILEKAVEFMKVIGIKFAEGELHRNELKTYRNDMMNKSKKPDMDMPKESKTSKKVRSDDEAVISEPAKPNKGMTTDSKNEAAEDWSIPTMMATTEEHLKMAELAD